MLTLSCFLPGSSSAVTSIDKDSNLLPHLNPENADCSIDYVGVEQIIITSDEDLMSFATAGSGTKEDPYMIKDYSVYGLGVTYGVIITNVTKHFTVEHCRILSIYGLVIENLPGVNINITNNIILQFGTFYQVDMLTCIRIINCNNIIISKNDIESNYRGIDISYASNVSIAENNINGRSDIDNLGIAFSGIALRKTMNCTATNNVFNKGGFDLDLTYHQLQFLTISNNTMNGLEIGYFVNASGTIITDPIFAQILLFNCSNIVVKNLNFLDIFRGIHCMFSSNCKFLNNTFNEGECGIKCSDSTNLILEKNLCDENYRGIEIKNCDTTDLIENKCSNTTRGEAIIVADSTNVNIQKNICSLNIRGFGIYVKGENITIVNNECNYNKEGIFLDSVQNCWVHNNTICYNGIGGGIVIFSGQEVVVCYNLLLENEMFGVSLFPECFDCLVHHNSFINNFVQPASNGQAFDSGIGNFWYHPDSLVGNFWSDRGMKRKYAIDGSAGSYDLYPLKDPIVLPDEDYPLKTPFPYIISFFSILIAVSIQRKTKFKPFS